MYMSYPESPYTKTRDLCHPVSGSEGRVLVVISSGMTPEDCPIPPGEGGTFGKCGFWCVVSK